ncbi:histidine--tRNA ligase [Candidatus Kaiserbacteria bacterium CG10_big_fil_rev_8_21_14_0_10_56_12]|uniref:Histidine--tRNA ligase n=1 Tax=Candidatus Kaiserbacteria bacterium CG10_big_fil_rev_8_21_14_0_10_56_12 TaxID=1974611 RepID=A0A2H0UBS5_9BACT|nr:MAG: histidine--tRNA ligase [Candidatus Kaiserbacteria bacterium CG10_big_fil_rev_8_21_14_0_10_56_12]
MGLMDEPLATEPYKGVRDFYPADWAKLQWIFTRLRETLALWGYEEYNASPLERAELYEAKTSEEIVNEQTYTFVDRGERRVTLRPEMTPTLARMVAAKRRELALPLRWFSLPNVFRYERPQRGRLREHYQLNVDLVGLPEGEADLETVQLAHALMQAFGADDASFVIKINSRPLLNAACRAAGLEDDKIQDYLRFLDRNEKISREEFLTATGTLSSQDPLSIIDTPDDHRDVATEKAKVLEHVARLKTAGVTNAVFAPHVTRGFDYYTGMVFEVFDTDPSNARSLFGGGRFDGLVALFGGEPVPAIGFGMGDVTLMDFLEAHGLVPDHVASTTQLYLGTPAPEDIPAAEAFAATLRKEGLRVFVNLTERALGDQIKDALKRSIHLFAAYGKDEVASGSLRVKVLATSTESTVTTAELIRLVRAER